MPQFLLQKNLNNSLGIASEVIKSIFKRVNLKIGIIEAEKKATPYAVFYTQEQCLLLSDIYFLQKDLRKDDVFLDYEDEPFLDVKEQHISHFVLLNSPNKNHENDISDRGELQQIKLDIKIPPKEEDQEQIDEMRVQHHKRKQKILENIQKNNSKLSKRALNSHRQQMLGQTISDNQFTETNMTFDTNGKPLHIKLINAASLKPAKLDMLPNRQYNLHSEFGNNQLLKKHASSQSREKNLKPLNHTPKNILVSQLQEEENESTQEQLANINEVLKPDYGVVVKNKIGQTVAQGDDYHNKDFKNKRRMNMSIYKTGLSNTYSLNMSSLYQSTQSQQDRNINIKDQDRTHLADAKIILQQDDSLTMDIDQSIVKLNTNQVNSLKNRFRHITRSQKRRQISTEQGFGQIMLSQTQDHNMLFESQANYKQQKQLLQEIRNNKISHLVQMFRVIIKQASQIQQKSQMSANQGHILVYNNNALNTTQEQKDQNALGRNSINQRFNLSLIDSNQSSTKQKIEYYGQQSIKAEKALKA
ncbi:UNKNOWN [Stylonychia lemnae]|uniref:Uncharacterized protein n=1 Tax=Stylonychia lemnae TaxID=5949 RepID=A0A078AAZ5_STYLE|nr:UNKNOWN [Stylonychia lemnae]|eukprot:CDW79435.1 UNKNOWN [Stylonychia lemnae]